VPTGWPWASSGRAWVIGPSSRLAELKPVFSIARAHASDHLTRRAGAARIHYLAGVGAIESDRLEANMRRVREIPDRCPPLPEVVDHLLSYCTVRAWSYLDVRAAR